MTGAPAHRPRVAAALNLSPRAPATAVGGNLVHAIDPEYDLPRPSQAAPLQSISNRAAAQ